MQVRHTVNPAIFEDKEGTSAHLNLSDKLAEVRLDNFKSQASDVTDLLDTVVFDVPFGGVTVGAGFWLRADGGDFDLEVNNSGQVIQVRRGKVSDPGGTLADAASARVFMEAIVSSLKVTPVGDIRLFWAIWGDAAP